MLPPGISLLSACLKRAGHKVKLFDTTYYNSVEIDGEIDQFIRAYLLMNMENKSVI